MLRLIAAIVGGLLVAVAITFATDTLFHALTPIAPPADPDDHAALGRYVARQPVALLVLVIAGAASAAFAGAASAARLARRGAWPGWLAGGLYLLATIANFAMIAHPLWLVIGSLAVVVGATWLGARRGARRPR